MTSIHGLKVVAFVLAGSLPAATAPAPTPAAPVPATVEVPAAAAVMSITVANPLADLEYLVVTSASANGRLVHYMGSAWDRGGRIRNAASWAAEVQVLASHLAAPLKIRLAINKNSEIAK